MLIMNNIHRNHSIREISWFNSLLCLLKCSANGVQQSHKLDILTGIPQIVVTQWFKDEQRIHHNLCKSCSKHSTRLWSVYCLEFTLPISHIHVFDQLGVNLNDKPAVPLRKRPNALLTRELDRIAQIYDDFGLWFPPFLLESLDYVFCLLGIIKYNFPYTHSVTHAKTQRHRCRFFRLHMYVTMHISTVSYLLVYVCIYVVHVCAYR